VNRTIWLGSRRRWAALLLGWLVLSAPLPVCAAPAVPSHAVILMYHHFGVPRYPTTNIDMERFGEQLDYLADHGYHVWPLTRIVDELRQGKPIPDHTVAITIDDAYMSVYERAFPLLKKHGWPFTVFVATGPIDRGYSAFMSWMQMREMQQHGASFANHSSSHDHLVLHRDGEGDAAWRRRVTADISDAQKRLRQELGRVPAIFSYPYGEYSEALAGIVRSMGLVGFGQQSGAVGVHSDMRVLPRFPIAGDYAAMDQFRTKIATLPLPVIDEVPWEMVTHDAQPALTLTLSSNSSIRPHTVHCYASGQGRIEIDHETGPNRQVTVRVEQPLPAGRSRYNCTAPSADGSRFYWFSHPWLYLPPGFVLPPD